MTDRMPERLDGILQPSGSHGWFPFTSLPSRPHLHWPENRSTAVSVVIDLRAPEWESPDTPPVIPPSGGRGIAPHPDFPRMSHREFGHRVGVFRLMDLLESVGILPAVTIDVLTVEKYGRLLEHVRGITAEFIAGGMSATRPITSNMTADEELHYIEATMDRLASGLEIRPDGWLGVSHGESFRTPGLLAKCGIRYVADWANDERPYPLTVEEADLWAFPLSWELSDLQAMHQRGVSSKDYGDSIVEACDVLTADPAESGRVLALHLHPWVSGQAFRAQELERALVTIRDHPGTWWATPGEVVAWCRSQSQSQQSELR